MKQKVYQRLLNAKPGHFLQVALCVYDTCVRTTALRPPAPPRDNTTAMRALLSLLIVAAIVLGGYYFYLKHMQPDGAGSNPMEAVSLTGVQNDLLAIAQAERAYLAQNGSYASLEELIRSGSLTMSRSGRDGYTYSVEITAGGFHVTARYNAPPGKTSGPGHPTIIVDQTLQVQQSE